MMQCVSTYYHFVNTNKNVLFLIYRSLKEFYLHSSKNRIRENCFTGKQGISDPDRSTIKRCTIGCDKTLSQDRNLNELHLPGSVGT